MLTAGLDEGAAQAALVLGPAGIGKSRLLQEFLTAAQRQAPKLKVLFAGADSLAAGSPFALLARRCAGTPAWSTARPPRRAGASCGQCPRPRRRDGASRLAAFLGELCRVPFPDAHSRRCAPPGPTRS